MLDKTSHYPLDNTVAPRYARRSRNAGLTRHGGKMQTFVPEDTFGACAAALDSKRLGKQRVEVLQILKALTGGSWGWRNHPATKMWEGHEAGLCAYGLAVCGEWVARGYKDTCADKMRAIISPDPTDLPWWWGNVEMMESHRSNLVRKAPDFYRPRYPSVSDALPYLWAKSEGVFEAGKAPIGVQTDARATAEVMSAIVRY